jgi:CRISPR-associated protein Cmr2
VVEGDYLGELIYAGGDDVLAVTPTANALECARALYDKYRSTEMMGQFKAATMSGGIVIAHYKEDLRFVLAAARRAERNAKQAGRDKVALQILRRSGEHTSVVLPWNLVAGRQEPNLQQLVQYYIGDPQSVSPSDRWAFALRAELPTFRECREVFQAELKRLLTRLELPKDQRDQFRTFVLKLFEEHCRVEPDGRPDKKLMLEDFVIACQSAAFLARGRDE